MSHPPSVPLLKRSQRGDRHNVSLVALAALPGGSRLLHFEGGGVQYDANR